MAAGSALVVQTIEIPSGLAQRTPCESDRGDGHPCPDCGAVLPARQGPLASWKSQRPGEWPGKLTDRSWSPEERERRTATFARKLGIRRPA